jgi:hypothetical protein
MRFNVSFRAAILVSAICCVALTMDAERVAGTKVEVEPPDGFVRDARFPGYSHKATGGSIVVTEISGPIGKLTAGMTKEGLGSRGMSLLESSELRIEDESARLLRVTQSAAGITYEKWILVFGDAHDSIFVVASYLESEAKTWREPLKESVLSTRRSVEVPLDQFEGLTFRITESPGLKISNRVANGLVLTEGGAEGPVSPENPLLLVAASINPVDLTNLKSFSELRLRQTAEIRDLENLEGRSVKVDEFDSWETIADATDKDSSVKLRVYQLVVADGTKYVLVQGLVGAARADEIIPQFREVALSLRRAR